MKNSKKGFMIPLIIAIVAILIIGVGIYYYSKTKVPTAIQPIASVVIDASTLEINSMSLPATIKGTAINTNTVSVNVYAPSPAKVAGMNWFGNKTIPVINGKWSLSISPDQLSGMVNFNPLTLQIGIVDSSGTVKLLTTGILKINQNVNSNQISNKTNDWKTYMNSKNNYLVQYPPNFSISDQNSNDWITIADKSLENNQDVPYPTFSIYVIPMVKGGLNFVSGKNLNDWILNNFNDKGLGKAMDIRSITVNGIEGFYFKNRNVGGAFAQFENAIVSDGNNVYLLQSPIEENVGQNKYMSQDDFLRSVNSFKFTK